LPVIYIDILFLLNFLMDTVVLFSTALIVKKHISITRLILTATLSAIYSVVMFFPQLSLLHSGFFKILFLILIAYIAFPSKKPKTVLKNTAAFLATNIIYGGMVFFLVFATDFGTATGAIISNGEIYLNISPGILLISALLSLSITVVLAHIKKQNVRFKKQAVSLTIVFGDRQASGMALCDTGCSLSDPISGKPSAIISPDFAKRILLFQPPASIPPERYRIIPYRTIDNQNGFLHGFISDKIILNATEITSIVIAISNQKLSDFDAIVNSDLVENQKLRKVVKTNNESKTYF